MRGAKPRPRLGDPLDRRPKRLPDQAQRGPRGSQISPLEGPAARLSGDPRREVVAVVLSDGTVQCIAEPAAERSPVAGFRKGQITGRGWTLWWEIRSWHE